MAFLFFSTFRLFLIKRKEVIPDSIHDTYTHISRIAVRENREHLAEFFFCDMILPASPLVSDDSTVPALTSATYSYWVSIKTAVFMNLLLFTFQFFRICEETPKQPLAPRRCFFRVAKRLALGLRTLHRMLKQMRFRTTRFAASLSDG